MKKRIKLNRVAGVLRIPIVFILLLFISLNAPAIEDGNPLVSHIFTADPSAHVFEGRVYIYGSHDKDNSSGYNMEDYHVLSSSNLVDWVDHGMVLHVSNVVWAVSRMWAPDCAYKDGTYYFYFPARDSTGAKRIGVATSDSPAGPFEPEETYIEGTNEIDPAVFVDDDEQVYLYWGGHTLKVAKLDETMKQIDGEITEVEVDYYYEGPWMHKKDGVYVLSYSTGSYHPDTSNHLIAYSTSTSPMGPFTYQGIVNGNVPGITNHGSTLKHKGQWYYFYHNTNLSGISTRRCIVADYMHHNDDGSIRTIIQTDLGIGQYDGLSAIEAENYTETETVEKRENTDDGLHVVFDPGDELIFTHVDMDDEVTTKVILRIASDSSTGSLEIRTESNQLLGSISIPDTGGTDVWVTVTNQIDQLSGSHDISLFFVNTETNQLRLDWFYFLGQEEDDRENLALNGTAVQSSTEYEGDASRAIDGDTNGAYAEGSVTHTTTEAQPWWELDLGGPYSINEIIVWGRTDSAFKERLSEYDVTLLDSASNAVWSSDQMNYPDPSVTLEPNGATGQYVRVQLRGTNALSLAEVQVFGFSGIPAGLVARWPMDDGSGDEVRDVSGYGFDAVRTGCVWVSGYAGGALEFNGSVSDDTVLIPTAVFDTVRNGISIAFWAYGDPNQQPMNSTLFAATDSNGNRILNIHLPWGGSVFWDAGNSDEFNRISKLATVGEYKGRWNHWVFTKDAVAGTMSIFLNGTLWHSVSGNSTPIGTVADACFGSGVNTDYYEGSLDDFCIYNYALTVDQISTLFGTAVYSGWASGYGLSGDDAQQMADVDGDGYDNLSEYALGMNPTNSDAGSRDWVALAAEDHSNWFDYIYYRRTNYVNEGLNYQLIDSTNLVNSVSSTNAQDQVLVGPAFDGYETVTNRYVTDDLIKFIQLKIRLD
ncbi:MAG: family 43 glycosylhydrolase [Pontiella sp.]